MRATLLSQTIKIKIKRRNVKIAVRVEDMEIKGVLKKFLILYWINQLLRDYA